jgi:hypothetical protein
VEVISSQMAVYGTCPLRTPPLNFEWPRRRSINTHNIKPTPEKMLMPTSRAVYITQQYELEQPNEPKYSCTFDGLNWVSLSALLILIKLAMEHLVVCAFTLFHTFPSARVRPPRSTLTLEDNSLTWWAQRMTWPSSWSPH